MELANVVVLRRCFGTVGYCCSSYSVVRVTRRMRPRPNSGFGARWGGAECRQGEEGTEQAGLGWWPRVGGLQRAVRHRGAAQGRMNEDGCSPRGTQTGTGSKDRTTFREGVMNK
jgi:hypothetical protein